jgi:hypothetical protein
MNKKMLRNVVILRGNVIIYRREYGELKSQSWEAISPLLVSLTYFIEESRDDVKADILNTVFYKIAYSTNKKKDLLYILVTDIGDSDETIAEQLQRFNLTVSGMLEGV